VRLCPTGARCETQRCWGCSPGHHTCVRVWNVLQHKTSLRISPRLSKCWVCVCVGLALNTGYWVDPMHRVRTQSAWSILRNGSARNEICTVYQHWNSFHRGGVAINDQAVVGVGEQRWRCNVENRVIQPGYWTRMYGTFSKTCHFLFWFTRTTQK